MTDSIYIHIPFCLSKCKYCDFFSVVCENKSIDEKYVSALCNEIKTRLKNNKVTQLNTVYIGGGTPSLLSESQLCEIFNSITSVSKINDNAEITIEVNPDDISESLLEMYENLYINRISCGIQTLNNSSLTFCGRRADFETNIKALDLLKKYWKKQLSLDLICGLPEENYETFEASLKKIISYGPDHISMYSLTIEDETPLGKMLSDGIFEYDFDYSDNMWLKGYELLENNGYEQYEVSNFCRKGFECKHNLRYWNHNDYIGCGSGGTGTVYNADGSGLRWTNSKNLSEYEKFWNGNSDYSDAPADVEEISVDDSKFEFFMMGLRKRSGIKKSRYFEVFNEEIPDRYLTVFEEWNKKHLLEIEKSSGDIIYYLNEKGILFLNSLLNQLI